LTAEVVLDGFILHALLRDARYRNYELILPHHTPQPQRMDHAMHARNVMMAGTGQAQWAHACDDCMKLKTDADGRTYRITACVTDGNTMGHTCCSYRSDDNEPCRQTLQTTQDRFCPLHASEEKLCAVRTCREPSQQGFMTCALSEHRRLETEHREKDQSFLQLKARLFYTQLAEATRNSTAHKTTPKKTKTVFHRTWTHNEQLAVRPCGVIVSRCTFYQAEAVSGDFLMATFPPELPGSRPTFLFYDDNCQLWRFLQNCGQRIREYFAKIGLPVDVFHFRSKHKITDNICQTHCNPASFPALRTGGKWTFNSSAAEQANVWFGKYSSIVREMHEHRYNFFLDEMISLHNQVVIERLEKNGKIPHLVPDDDLCAPVYVS
ncbi:hypothetical protein AURDEDRAFT_51957, partial [Auricularia subglabra TFB-10046 SS5]